MNPDDDTTMPEFTGEVYLTVTVTVNRTEAPDQTTIEMDALDAVRSTLRNLPDTNVIIEDSDLMITNAEEDWLDKADRLYEQKMDK